MDLLIAVIVIGLILIVIAGCAFFLLYSWQKQSLAKIAEERALTARRLQAISQRELEEMAREKEKRAKAKQARKKERRARRAVAHQLPFENQTENTENIAPEAPKVEAPKVSVVSDLGNRSP